MPDRCFVISPIGPEGSDVRRHADDVFDYIIKPAVDECGLTAVRSDHLLEPGRVTEQMFREIVTSACCVAVLTGNNPNVYYELAIAQAAGTPVVALLEKGHPVPFDIQDLRCVRYDLSPRPLFERTYVREVTGHLKNSAAAGWNARPAFGDLILHRLVRTGLPASLVAELTLDWTAKRHTLSPTQLRVLEAIAKDQSGLGLHPKDIMAAVKLGNETQAYYRLESLRLLGFLEKRRENFLLSPGYQAALAREAKG